MAQVLVEVHGKAYGVGCEDGEESHVRALAGLIDAKAREVAPDAAVVGETRTILLAALMLADELEALKGRLEAAEARLARVEAAERDAESRAVAALEAAAQKLEALAAK